MEHKYNKQLKPLATALRHNMTREEKKLWYDFLRKNKVKFIRQKIIGNYIADFYSNEAKLVIELDGSQHYRKNNRDNDKIRTKYFEQYGLKVMRIPNREINQNFLGVCEGIQYHIEQRLKSKL